MQQDFVATSHGFQSHSLRLTNRYIVGKKAFGEYAVAFPPQRISKPIRE